MSRVPLVDADDVEEQDLSEVIEGLPEEYQKAPHVQGDLITSGSVAQTLENNQSIHQFHNNSFRTLWQTETTGLEPKETELVILSTGRGFGPESGKTVWNTHLMNFIEVGGGTEEEIRAIARGDFDALDDNLAALARYADAMATRDVTDELYAELAEHYDDRTIVGVMMLAGYYALANHLISAIGEDAMQPAEGYDHLRYDELYE